MRFNFKLLTYASSIVLCSLVLSSPAKGEVKPYPACERDPTESDVSAAKGAYEAGQVSFQEADYERSLLYWEDAFRRDCTAVKLLLNLARAYELSQDREAAVNALQTYIDRRPDAKDRQTTEKWLASLQRQIAAEQQPAADEPDAEATPEGNEPDDESTAAPVTPSEGSPKTKKPSWPVWLTAGGVVVAIVGHGTVARGESLREERAEELGCDLAANECPDNETRNQVNAAGEDERSAGTSLAVVGHLAGITGGVFWWILWTQTKSSDVAQADRKTLFQPVVAPGYQGLNFSGRF